jgi:hypothetical protein
LVFVIRLMSLRKSVPHRNAPPNRTSIYAKNWPWRARMPDLRGEKKFKIAKKYLPFSYLSVTQSVEKKLNQQNIRHASPPTMRNLKQQSARGTHELVEGTTHNGAFVQEAARVTAARIVP